MDVLKNKNKKQAPQVRRRERVPGEISNQVRMKVYSVSPTHLSAILQNPPRPDRGLSIYQGQQAKTVALFDKFFTEAIRG